MGLSTKGADFIKVQRTAEQLTATVPPASSAISSNVAAGRREEHQVVAQVLLEICPLRPDSCAGVYLAKRGVLDAAMSDGWGALPAGHELEHVLGELYLACGEELVEASGIAHRGRLLRPDHRVIIPFRGPDGNVDVIQRRLAVEGAPPQPKYLFPSGLVPLWPYGLERLVDAAAPETPVLFVEGCIDVLAARLLARHAGVGRVVVGVPSCDLWSPSWACIGAGRQVVVGVDADNAGHRLALQMRGDLVAAGAARVERWVPVGAKDWGDCWRQHAARSS